MSSVTNIWKTLNQDVELKSPIYIKRRLFDSIAAMVKAGIDVVAALESLEADRRSDYERQLISDIIEDLREGMPIWQTFKKYGLIQSQLITLVRIGEESGNLPKSMEAAQSQMSKSKKFRSSLRSASVYPAFILILLVVVTVVIIGFVLPRLTQVYSSFGSDLPFATQVMIQIGDFMAQYGLIFVPTALVLIFGTVYILFFNSRTKFLGDNLMFRLPFIHKVLVEVQIARMGQMLNNLLSAGISLDDALQLLSETTEFNTYARFYLQIKTELSEGNSLHDIFSDMPKSEWMLPLLAQQLIVSGEQTGELTHAFGKVGEEFEARTEASAKDFSTLFEPILIIFVWLGVGLVAFAVIIPLYSVVGSFNDIVAPSGTVRQSYPPQIIDFADPERQELTSGSALEILTNTSENLDTSETTE